MTTPPEERAPDEALPSLASKCVRALLDRHGVPKHKHSAVVGEILGITYLKAHRKIKDQQGASPWTLEELHTLSNHWNEDLQDMVSAMHLDDSHSAVLVVGDVRATCRLWLGHPVQCAQPGELVAVRPATEWLVMPGSLSMPGQAFAVERLVLNRDQRHRHRIAVLDDVPAVGDGVANDLRELGFDAQAFSNQEELIDAFRCAPFDGYVLDWRLQNENALKTIQVIRQTSPLCPIIVLSGDVSTGSAAESEVAQAQIAYNLRFHRKPASIPILASEFRLAMGTSQ